MSQDTVTRFGYWVRAGTSIDQPYPCNCKYKNCTWQHCADRQRTDTEHLPRTCCAQRGAARLSGGGVVGPGRAGERLGGPGGYSNTPGALREPRKPREAVAGSPGRDLDLDLDLDLGLRGGSLWDAPPENPPPAWDAIDEVSGSHGETREDPSGYSNSPQGEENTGEALVWSVADVRQRVAALHCECRTPWDAEPPSLLLADTKDGPVRSIHPLSTRPGADVRAEALKILAKLGHELVTRRGEQWRDGRHSLLPPADPGSRVRTRPGWLGALGGGGVAVVDLPGAPTGGGVHCGECCRNFANAGAYQLHRGSWGDPCKDPAQIRTVERVEVQRGRIVGGVLTSSCVAGVERGVPMLKRSAGGVWSVDPMAPWGLAGPSMTPEQAQQRWASAQQRLAARPRWQFGRGANRVGT